MIPFQKGPNHRTMAESIGPRRKGRGGVLLRFLVRPSLLKASRNDYVTVILGRRSNVDLLELDRTGASVAGRQGRERMAF